MFRVVALLLLVAAVSETIGLTPAASKNCFCSKGDRATVLRQWRRLFETEDGMFRAAVGRQLLIALNETHPETVPLFYRVDIANPYSAKFTAHAYRLFNAFDLTINLLGNPETLNEVLNRLSDQHIARPGVRKLYFATVRETLHVALPILLDEYDHLSWRQCMDWIIDRIASQLPD